MVAYPAKVEAEGKDMFMLTMPDIPELVVVARRRRDALEKAPGLLHSILDAYRADSRPLPSASHIRGAPMVTAKRDWMALVN